ncbi:MAG: hypothetical protein HQK53_07030 [Oligoflexia bacterium]|nr:hypothetical protein [Oligoflexia bacterium]
MKQCMQLLAILLIAMISFDRAWAGGVIISSTGDLCNGPVKEGCILSIIGHEKSFQRPFFLSLQEYMRSKITASKDNEQYHSYLFLQALTVCSTIKMEYAPFHEESAVENKSQLCVDRRNLQNILNAIDWSKVLIVAQEKNSEDAIKSLLFNYYKECVSSEDIKSIDQKCFAIKKINLSAAKIAAQEIATNTTESILKNEGGPFYEMLANKKKIAVSFSKNTAAGLSDISVKTGTLIEKIESLKGWVAAAEAKIKPIIDKYLSLGKSLTQYDDRVVSANTAELGHQADDALLRLNNKINQYSSEVIGTNSGNIEAEGGTYNKNIGFICATYYCAYVGQVKLEQVLAKEHVKSIIPIDLTTACTKGSAGAAIDPEIVERRGLCRRGEILINDNERKIKVPISDICNDWLRREENVATKIIKWDPRVDNLATVVDEKIGIIKSCIDKYMKIQ